MILEKKRFQPGPVHYSALANPIITCFSDLISTKTQLFSDLYQFYIPKERFRISAGAPFLPLLRP